MSDKLALFEEKQIRKTWKDDKWYFSIEDVVFALTDSCDPKQYIQKLKKGMNILIKDGYKLYIPLKWIQEAGNRE